MERRRHERHTLSLSLVMASQDPMFRFNGRCEVIDVSASGVGVRAGWVLPPGTPIRLATLGSVHIAAGRVVRTNPLNQGGGWHLGVKFEYEHAEMVKSP